MKVTDPKPMAAKKRSALATDLSFDEAAAQQAAAFETLAMAMPHKANKSKEFGRHNAVSPPAGQTVALVGTGLGQRPVPSAKPTHRRRPAIARQPALPPRPARSTGRAPTPLARG